MKKRIKLLAAILGISCLCGCSKLLGDYGRIDEVPEPNYQIADYSDVKEGYYLSDSDDSYIVIKDKTLNLVGIDWEAQYREREPRQENQTESEYEEDVSQYVQYCFTNQYTNQIFIPVKHINVPEGFQFPYLELVTNTTEETIREHDVDGRFGSGTGHLTMLDENTIRYDTWNNSLIFIYCGTSLPESE